jgi:hypothetical protein
MHSTFLSHFLGTRPTSLIPHGWQWFHDQQMLALVYSEFDQQSYSSRCFFVLFDVPTRTIQHSTAWDYLGGEIETLRVVYVPHDQSWVVSSVSDSVLIHRFTFEEPKQDISAQVLFEDRTNDQVWIGPIYAFWQEKKQCVVIYQKPEADFAGDTLIYMGKGTLFDASQERTVLGDGNAALVCAHADTTLLLTLNPRKGETTWGWGLRLSCYASSSFARLWQRELDLSIPDAPTPLLTGENDLEWLGINATILPGQFSPGSTQQSWIVGATMVDIFQISGRGHSSLEASLVRKQASLLAWLDDTGQELWRCSDALGLRLQFCQIGVVVVGVDLYEGRWRLWTWHPHQHLALQHIVPLDQGLLRAHVLREENGESQQFWLLEEFENGIKISHYATAFFQEAPSTTWLSNRHLLEPQNGCGSLNWHEEIDAWVDGNTLFFLCLDEKQQLSLYQVE